MYGNFRDSSPSAASSDILSCSEGSQPNSSRSIFEPDSAEDATGYTSANSLAQQILEKEMLLNYENPDNNYSQSFQDLQILEGYFLDLNFPQTPSELSDHPNEYTGCISSQFQYLGAISEPPHADSQVVFKHFISSSTPVSSSQELATRSYETPPATPTEDQAFSDLPGQQLSTNNPPSRRARLGGISWAECEPDNDLMDAQDCEIENVFSDTELPAEPDFSSGDHSAETTPNADVTDLDPRLKEAWNRCQGSKTLEPLLKEELRLKIMKKRLEKGEEELEVKFEAPPIYQMTAEDHARRNLRRAQNRGAAQRFRQRKKEKEIETRKRVEEGERKKRQLTNEVACLRRELVRLQDLVNQHRQCSSFLRLQTAAASDFLHVPDVTALCQQIGAIENIDGRPR